MRRDLVWFRNWLFLAEDVVLKTNKESTVLELGNSLRVVRDEETIEFLRDQRVPIATLRRAFFSIRDDYLHL